MAQMAESDSYHTRGHGLYEAACEQGSCGIGAVVNIDGARSHRILELGNRILLNLQHRGAAGSDGITGDGAGILIQVPHEFLTAEASRLGIVLGQPGRYGVGMIFRPKDPSVAEACDQLLGGAAEHSGLRLLGWRDVPTDDSCLGELARASEPSVRQVFIDGAGLSGEELERRLYLVRKRTERLVRERFAHQAVDYYVVSMSCRTMCYKGMFLAPQLFAYYPDLSDSRMASSLALVHQRYSTNTFPNWRLAQPLRMIAHNGEINTIRGNANRMKARERLLKCEQLGEDLGELLPILDPGGSDSAQFDNALELLVRAGRSLPHAVMIMVPEAFGPAHHISTDKRAFYEYHAAIMEPWDGPAAIVFTDGRLVGGTLDRNGLRPARYVITTDGLLVLSSEVGVIDLPAKRIRRKGRLEPGRMFLVDTHEGRVIQDNEIKGRIARQRPYRRWLEQNRIELRGLFAGTPSASKAEPVEPAALHRRMLAFGCTREEQKMILAPMALNAQEPIGSMGTDTPLAVLSERPKLLFDYFKQGFAQVTNPPIDPLREGLVMSLMSFTGTQRNLLDETPEHCRQLKLPHPILTNEDMARLRAVRQDDFKVATVDALFDARGDDPENALRRALAAMVDACESAIRSGASLIVISDRNFNDASAAIPSLLATAAAHHGLLKRDLRGQAGLVVETGEVREVMHFCLLCGYGANAINPYLAFEMLGYLQANGEIPEGLEPEQLVDNYISAVKKGILKTISKMGISTLRSYHSAQLFEAIGLDREIVEEYFTGTPSRIQGAGLETIAREALWRHEKAFGVQQGLKAAIHRGLEATAPNAAGCEGPPTRYIALGTPNPSCGGALPEIEFGGEYHYRCDGEAHSWNPQTVSLLQRAVRSNDPQAYAEYSRLINDQSRRPYTLRGLFEFVPGDPVTIEEVEAAEEIVKRFCTGAMSHGSISKEAHETIALAMNRLGAMSNTGEGGEDPARYQTRRKGESVNCAIKQVASARFGVTMEYLSNARVLQIKMAQGAKPGEGGQLPGHKVTEEIAHLRHSTPGVTLISPPPHHDIYSIEDLAQLIYDLKCANPDAKVSVKLVAELGVGTVAAGVAKANADEVLISGHDGGTGASPLSSIKHAGIPWELGLAETQQTLVLNGLRDRIQVQVDGQLKTGRDVVIGALLGAERFGFATAALVSLGCVLMRKCHLGTCPVGIGTQDPQLRKRFAGRPEHLQRFMLFVAEEVRQIMAQLGFKRFDDMVGRVERLGHRKAIDHWKSKGLDFSAVFDRVTPRHSIAEGGHSPIPKLEAASGQPLRRLRGQTELLKDHLDWQIIDKVSRSIDNGERTSIEMPITNVHRAVGTILSNRIIRARGPKGLPDGTIEITLRGSAGQSFGAFLVPGITLRLIGDSNDYLGKGLSGGRIVVQTPPEAPFAPHENIIAGNTLLYGATSGEVFINGLVGERFAVRNSGAVAVVEGVGDHGCEYMTGGTVVVIGQTGRNFAAGMSGGIAYVLDEHQLLDTLCNLDMVDIEPVLQDQDVRLLHDLISRHHRWTGSRCAQQLLARWSETLGKFVKIIPIDYRQAMLRLKERELRETEAVPATEEVYRD